MDGGETAHGRSEQMKYGQNLWKTTTENLRIF